MWFVCSSCNLFTQSLLTRRTKSTLNLLIANQKLLLLNIESPQGTSFLHTKLSPIRPYYRLFRPQRQQKTKEIGRKIAKSGRAIRYLVGEEGSMAVRLPSTQSLRDQCHLLTHLNHPVTLHDDDGDGDLNSFLDLLQHDFQCYFQFH